MKQPAIAILAVVAALAVLPSAAWSLQAPPIDDLSAVAQGDRVQLDWTVTGSPDGDLITAVEIRYLTTGPIETEAAWEAAAVIWELDDPTIIEPGGSASFTYLTDVLPAGTYYFAGRVATGEWGPLSTDNPDPVTIGNSSTVPPVTGLAVQQASATSTTLTLTWNALTGGGTQIRLFYSTSPTGDPSTPATDWISGSPTQAVVTLPLPSTTYRFAAKARNASNVESVLSAGPHPSGTTLADNDPPDPPAGGSDSSSGCGGSAAGAGLLPALAALAAAGFRRPRRD